MTVGTADTYSLHDVVVSREVELLAQCAQVFPGDAAVAIHVDTEEHVVFAAARGDCNLPNLANDLTNQLSQLSRSAKKNLTV